MALTVGELVALVDVEDDGMRSGLNRAEQQVERAGREIDRTAEQAGQRAGRDLGEGIADGAGEGVEGAGDEVTGGLLSLKDGLKGVAAGIGIAAGAMLMSAMGDAMEQSRIVGRLGAQLGATPKEAKKYGEIAGSMYADAVTEDFQGAADAISATMRAGLLPTGATEKQIEDISTKVSDLASTFELDLGQTANAVGQMMKTGLAKNATEALDAIARGMQEMGPRADDLMDTFNEYSTQFRQLGLDAKTATGILSQGMKAGARDTDIVADSLKEFVLIAQGGGAKVDDAFAAIGLSGDEMQRVFTEGGPAARDALDEVFDRLRKVKDPAKRSALALQLFGTKSEDMQKALYSIDPSDAVEALGKVKGAADGVGDSLRDNAGTRVEQFKRGIQQGVVDFLGGTVIPALTKFKDAFSNMWDEAGKGADNLPDHIVNMFELLGQKIFDKIQELAPKAIEALISFGQKIADYVTANPMEVLKIAAIAAALVVAFLSLPALIAAALVTAATTIITSFVKKLVSNTVEKLGEWWASFKTWFATKASQAGDVLDALGVAMKSWFLGLWKDYIADPVSGAWNSFIDTVEALPGRAVDGLSSLGARLVGVAYGAWVDFKRATQRKVGDVLSYARGIPRRLIDAVGDLNSLLYNKGMDVVTGLWNGIKAMGSWLRSTLVGWARNIIPGPIADALGIASPSKVMRDQVGRWIPAGIVAGIEKGQGQLDAAMRSLVQPPAVPRMQLAGTGMPASALGASFGGQTPGGGPLVAIENWNAADNGTPEQNAAALEWKAKGRG